MRFLPVAVLLALAGCGVDPATLSQPDMVMRDIAMVQPNECANGFTDGEETDQDCGGPTCGPCDTGKGCKMGRDCQSGSCTNRVCDPPSCADRIKNGRETDIDCGGGTCSGCDLGKPCVDGPDCKSMTCKNAMCAPSPCTNMVKDGTETDVDCGGGSCPACGDGKMCQQGTDCKTGTCTNNVCKSPVMCMAGTADCDGNAGNGCEISTNTDAKNCGGCGRACPMNMPGCVVGKCSGNKAMVLYVTILPWAQDVQAKLVGTGAFGAVDLFDLAMGTPTVQQLQGYSAVLFFTAGGPPADPIALGDNLATYYDGGGRVVVAVRATADFPAKGRFGTVANGYMLIDPKGIANSPPNLSLGKVNEPNSPLMSNVTKLTMEAPILSAGGVVNGGIVVAQWSNGDPMIVRGVVKGRDRVDLNLFPVSADAQSNLWKGDGAIIMRNALIY